MPTRSGADSLEHLGEVFELKIWLELRVCKLQATSASLNRNFSIGKRRKRPTEVHSSEREIWPGSTSSPCYFDCRSRRNGLGDVPILARRRRHNDPHYHQHADADSCPHGHGHTDPGGDNNVLIFAATANGNVAPVATLGGSNTKIAAPNALAFDLSGLLYVANGGSPAGITVYAAGATGNAAPVRTLAGTGTMITARSESRSTQIGSSTWRTPPTASWCSPPAPPAIARR